MPKPKPAWGYEPNGTPLTPEKKKALVQFFNTELKKQNRPLLTESLGRDLVRAVGLLAGLAGNRGEMPGKPEVKAALERVHKAAFELSGMLGQLDWVSRQVLRKHLRVPEPIERHQQRTTDLWSAAKEALTAEFSPEQGDTLRRDEMQFEKALLTRLVSIYKEAFGSDPGQGYGPFFRIVKHCLTLSGNPPHSDEALEIRIRRALS